VSPATALGPADLLRLLRRDAGLDLTALKPTADGESGSAYWVTDRAGEVLLLKLLPGPAAAGLSYLRALAAVVDRLRERGYPAPRLRAAGQAAGLVFWIQERADGTTLTAPSGRPDADRILAALPELIRLNDAQAGLGTSSGGPVPDGSVPDGSVPGSGAQLSWRGLIRQTLTEGGAGYCRPETLAGRADTRDLLEVLRRVADSCCDAVPAATDFVHYDFSPSNLLGSVRPDHRPASAGSAVTGPASTGPASTGSASTGTAITAVIDINPPVLAGDRAFDLATMLFYCYEHDELRRLLRARLLELASARAARAYLAHMVLRQTDWSLRFYPDAESTRYFLRLARLVTADIDDGARFGTAGGTAASGTPASGTQS
jgi:Phosphotransferase enzyme family